MADDIKVDELVDQIRESYAASIRIAEPGIPAHAALQLADTLVAVQMDWRRGKPLQEIMRDHGCSRAAAYKYHPSKMQRRA
jgi:hypothetical protein